MALKTNSLLYETWQTYLCYLGAALAALPAGIVYSVMTMHGTIQPWARPLFILAAVVLAHFGYVGALKLQQRNRATARPVRASSGGVLAIGWEQNRSGVLVVGGVGLAFWVVVAYWLILLHR
jgi:Na+/H+-translocating membrane pyrophosphatase